MREDDLDKGLQNIKDILLRLEKQAHEIQLLKEFPRPAPAEKPEALPQVPAQAQTEEPRPEIPAVQQITEQPPVDEPEKKKEAFPEKPAEPRAEPKPELPAVQQAAEQPPVSGPEKAVVKRAAGLKLKTLVVLCLGFTVAAAVYQFGFNSSKYRLKQASKLEQSGDKKNAIAAYERLIWKYPATEEAAASRYAIGNIKSERGEPGAIEDYRKFLSMAPAGDPKIADAKFKIAEIRFNEGAFSEAAKSYADMDIRTSDHSQKAAERLSQIKAVEAQAAAAQNQITADTAKAAATAQAKLGRSILLANRKHLGGRVAGNAKSFKTAPLKDRYKVCYPIWLAEKKQVKSEASLISTKNNYSCDALKESMTVCERSHENTTAIKTQTAEERASKVKSVVTGWTVQKQESLDKKMLKLYEENRCVELLESVTQSEGEEALDAF